MIGLTMNVFYSSDNNYAQHMGVSIWSLLENNRKFKAINIYIMENGISVQNKEKLSQIENQFVNAKIYFISFSKYSKMLNLNMPWHISISAYARLFAGVALPQGVHRVLYLDCDTVVCRSLYDLWNYDIHNNVAGVVQDTVGDNSKKQLGLSVIQKYFNSGMILLDLDMWRQLKIEQRCINFINQHQGNVHHHDQGVLNSLLYDKVEIVPMRFNVITIHYFFSIKKIRKYYKEHAEFYTDREINEAKEEPVILHFTPSLTCRPWVKGCKHPFKNRYWEILEKTPWKGAPLQKNTTKWYIRLIEWRYRNIPF